MEAHMIIMEALGKIWDYLVGRLWGRLLIISTPIAGLLLQYRYIILSDECREGYYACEPPFIYVHTIGAASLWFVGLAAVTIFTVLMVEFLLWVARGNRKKQKASD